MTYDGTRQADVPLTRADTLILPNSAIRAGMLSTRVPSLSGRVNCNLHIPMGRPNFIRSDTISA